MEDCDESREQQLVEPQQFDGSLKSTSLTPRALFDTQKKGHKNCSQQEVDLLAQRDFLCYCWPRKGQIQSAVGELRFEETIQGGGVDVAEAELRFQSVTNFFSPKR